MARASTVCMNAKVAMIRDTSAQDRRIEPPPRGPRRWITLGAIAGAVVLALVVGIPVVARMLSAERSVDIERLRVAAVERGTLLRDVSVNGRVVAAVSPTLYAPVSGTVTLRTQAGDTVSRGAPLAQIDSPELTNELERERATLQELEVEVQRQRIASQRQNLTTRRTADDAQVSLQAAEREMQRAEDAWAKGAIAQVDYLRARDTLETARISAEHSAADAKLQEDAVEFELAARESQLARQQLVVKDLERRVDELNVRSPVDGIVGTVAVVDRAVVAANAPLITVVDLTQLEVELEVPESYADDLGIGMQAEVRYGSTTYPGVVSAISPEVVNGTVRARVRFESEQPEGLRQNQRLMTRVLIEEKPGVLMVQRGPFVDSGGGRYAFVIADDIATRRAIEIGSTSSTAVEIVSGVEEGERVVISGYDEFEDADRVLITD